VSVSVSILDLAPVTEGATPADALRRTIDLAQHAERWGYTRFWLAEHHNMTGIASAATSVVIGAVAAATHTMRVGSGGIMLPNHSPLVIAEQFGTLESLYPGRVDLGLGRAPGTDQGTVRALRRPPMASDTFAEDVRELQALLGPVRDGQSIQATPGAGTNVPIWILGSSMFGAQLAARYGLPYAHASHFMPDLLMPALESYRAGFTASAQLAKPYAIAGVSVYAADTDAEARRLMTSVQQSITNRFRGRAGRLPPPIDDIDRYWNPAEQAEVSARMACTAVGTASTVREGLLRFIEQTQVDEIIVVSAIYDHAARLRCYEIVADALIAPR
jgi:luciferase family oxidoreductase group 1